MLDVWEEPRKGYGRARSRSRDDGDRRGRHARICGRRLRDGRRPTAEEAVLAAPRGQREHHAAAVGRRDPAEPELLRDRSALQRPVYPLGWATDPDSTKPSIAAWTPAVGAARRVLSWRLLKSDPAAVAFDVFRHADGGAAVKNQRARPIRGDDRLHRRRPRRVARPHLLVLPAWCRGRRRPSRRACRPARRRRPRPTRSRFATT